MIKFRQILYKKMILVSQDEKTKKWKWSDYVYPATFHQWMQDSNEDQSSHGDWIVNTYPVALVELPDGTMDKLIPDQVKFFDYPGVLDVSEYDPGSPGELNLKDLRLPHVLASLVTKKMTAVSGGLKMKLNFNTDLFYSYTEGFSLYFGGMDQTTRVVLLNLTNAVHFMVLEEMFKKPRTKSE